MERRFLKELWRQLPKVPRKERRVLSQQIRERRDALIAHSPYGDEDRDEYREEDDRGGDGGHDGDRATQLHLGLAALVLSTHQILRQQAIDPSSAMNALTHAVLKPNSWAIRFATKVMLSFARDPMERIVRYTGAQVPKSYGRRFRFQEEGDAMGEYTMRVTRCFYHEYFTKASAPELTPIFCAWDKHWIGAISPSRHGVAFERASTIAEGAESCPFTFRRTQGRE